MLHRRFTLRDLPLHRRSVPWQLSAEDRYAERARRFFQGAPLALGAGIALLPAWLFLVHSPRFAYAQAVAVVVLPMLGIAAALGVGKLVSCALEHPFDYLTVVSFGVLIVFAVVLVYAGVFLYILYWA